jgi:type 1 fimbria pilin
MKAKSIVFTLLAGGLLSISSAYADTVTTAGGTINFEGRVVDGACAVSVDSLNQTITLDQVRAAKLASPGEAAGQQKFFNIKLEECDTTSYSNVAVTFNGQSDATAAGALANTTGAGAATNVALQLYGQDGQPLALGTASADTLLNDGQNILSFGVDYIATEAAATSGSVSAAATFTTTYS